MKRDDYYLHMRNGPLLIQFGALDLQKKEKDRCSDISYTLRCIVKLIMEFESVSGKEDVFGKDLIAPENFENIVKAVTKRKAHIPEELSEKEDVKAVRSCCINEILRIYRKIKKSGMRRDDYWQLSKTTLVQLITSNARRGGEPSKLKLVDWEGVKDNKMEATNRY